MSKYFEINGYWKDDQEEFEGYIVKEFDDTEEDEQKDDRIFFYGLSESAIQQAIADGADGTVLEFVITSYEEIDF